MHQSDAEALADALAAKAPAGIEYEVCGSADAPARADGTQPDFGGFYVRRVDTTRRKADDADAPAAKGDQLQLTVF